MFFTCVILQKKLSSPIRNGRPSLPSGSATATQQSRGLISCGECQTRPEGVGGANSGDLVAAFLVLVASVKIK